MAVSYSCDACDKEFNLQIKLKKHIATEHKVLNTKTVDYMDEEVKFTDDEKAQYYDDLKSKYDEVKKKIKLLQSKCGEIQLKKNLHPWIATTDNFSPEN